MPVPHLNTLIRVSLAGAMLVSTLTLPIGIAHNHAEGDDLHAPDSLAACTNSHESGHGHSHAHSHGKSNQHAHSHDHHFDRPGTSRWIAAYSHVHVTILGIEVTFPNAPNSDEDPSLRFIKAAPAITTAPSTTGLDRAKLHGTLVAACPHDKLSSPVAVHSKCSRVTACFAILCDTARHERSGVLLI